MPRARALGRLSSFLQITYLVISAEEESFHAKFSARLHSSLFDAHQQRRRLGLGDQAAIVAGDPGRPMRGKRNPRKREKQRYQRLGTGSR